MPIHQGSPMASFFAKRALRRDLLHVVLLFQGFLLFFNEGSEHSYFAITVLFKIKTELLAESELQQVVIQTFLGNLHLGSCVLQTPSLKLDFTRLPIRNHDTVVQLSPSTDLLNDLGDGSLLSPLFLYIRVGDRPRFYDSFRLKIATDVDRS
jgi:hypothetical protein